MDGVDYAVVAEKAELIMTLAVVAFAETVLRFVIHAVDVGLLPLHVILV